MTKTLTPTENSKKQSNGTKTPPKTSITQRLWTDFGRSELCSIDDYPTDIDKQVYGIPTYPLTAKANSTLEFGYHLHN